MFKLFTKVFGSKKKKTEPTPEVNPNPEKKDAAEQTSVSAHSEPKPGDQLVTTPANEESHGKPAMTEREELIENALAIHREKSKILDSLPPAVRTKLTAMAMAIYIKKRSDNEKH